MTRELKMKKIKVAQLGMVITGTTPPSKSVDNWGSAANFLTPSDIDGFDCSVRTERHISESVLKQFESRIVPPGSISIVCIGATIGKLAFIDEPTLTNQQINSIVPNRNLIDPKYLFYKFQLLSPNLKRTAGGSATPLLVKSDFERIEIEVHDIAEQRPIGKLFSKIDNLINQNIEILNSLKLQLDRTYAHWFVSFEFPDRQGNPYKSSGGEMIYSSSLQRDIPLDWNSVKIEDYFTFEKGGEPGAESYHQLESEGLIPFYRVSDVPKSKPVFVSHSLRNLRFCDFNDVLVTFDGTVGKILFGKQGSYSSALRKIASKENAHSNGFVYSVVSSLHVQQSIQRYSTGSVLLHASESIKHLYMPYNCEVVQKFDSFAKPLFLRMVELSKEVENLEVFKRKLIPQVMNNWVKI
jgi:type I restriction enzyme S subunit